MVLGLFLADTVLVVSQTTTERIDMKVYKTPVKAHPFASQVKVSKTKEGKWMIVRGSNWTELPASAFSNWDEALWTGISWANTEYQKEVEYAEAEAVWQLQH